MALVVVPVIASFGQQSPRALRLMVLAGTVVTCLLLRAVDARDQAARVVGERAATHARFAAFLRHSSDVVTVVDRQGAIRYISPSVARVFGYQVDDLLARDLNTLVHPDDRRRVLDAVVQAADGGSASTLVECRVMHRDRTWRYAETAVSSHLDDPEVDGIIFNTRDISDRKALEEQLAHQAFHDPLTRLANRALLRDRVHTAVARAERRHRPMAVLVLDLDGFKIINDTLGHEAGDAVLVAVARRLLDVIRPTDTAARLGGDEFAVLVEDLADPADWKVVGDRVLLSLQEPFHVQGKDVFVHASIGVAVCDDSVCDPDDLIRNADVAMYVAKARGKNCHELFRPSMHEEMLRRLDIEADLRRALDRGEFVLNYQPTVELRTGRIVGVEALVRWQHPERGLVPPMEFIPVAEDTGLIVELGTWVLREACRQARRWHDAHAFEPLLTMSVNLSARQLVADSLLDTVRAAVEDAGIPASCLVLEITETAVMNDAQSTVTRLQQLKALGVRLAIDDFGTGYSSLSYLRRFPIDVLKIDRSFVAGVPDSSQRQALLRTIVELGRSLELETVAEGIELAEELRELRELSCDLGQGYFFARPVTADALADLLRRGAVRPGAAGPAAAVGRFGLRGADPSPAPAGAPLASPAT